MIRVIGLTGGSGAGKGEAARIFARCGIPAVDTDAVYHELLQNDDALTDALASAFGNGILTDGRVDRKKLAAAVFGKPDTPALLAKLNAITHPVILARTGKIVAELLAGGARAVLIDAPQLFEAGAEKTCDTVVAVLADKQTRAARITARDGISEAEALRRIEAQHDDEFYRARCQYILQNDGTQAELAQKIADFLKETGLYDET